MKIGVFGEILALRWGRISERDLLALKQHNTLTKTQYNIDASDLLRLLLNGGNSTKTGYLAGALRQTGRGGLADEILSAIKSRLRRA
jgi:hypothetical protein